MTHAVRFELFFVIHARTNYLSILLGVPGHNATRAITLSELLLSDGKSLCDLVDSFFVGIELDSLLLCISLGPIFYLFGLFVNVHQVTVCRSRPEKRKNYSNVLLYYYSSLRHMLPFFKKHNRLEI